LIVVDVNVVVYLLTECPQHEAAAELWAIDGDWRLPPLWQHEFLNLLATLSRQNYLDLATAIEVWQTAVSLFARREMPPDMLRALRLAFTHGISAYDAQYVALAHELGCSLVTEDRRLREAFPDIARSLLEARNS